MRRTTLWTHAPAAAVVIALAAPLACVSPGGAGVSASQASSESTGETDGETTTDGTTATTADATSTTTGEPACTCSEAGQACVAGACVDVTEIERGCHPLSQGICLYPWPSSFTTVSDPATATGLRLALDAELLPVNTKGEKFAVDEVSNVMDGFSPHSQIRFLLRGGVRSSDLPPLDGIGGSLDDDAPIVLLREGGERWPHFAEVDARAVDPSLQGVFIRPARRLDFGARYLVAVRGLHDPSGALIEPTPAFVALRDDLPTDVPEIEALRPLYADLFQRLESAGIARADLQLAWDFTTASSTAIKRDMAALVPQVVAAAGDGHLAYNIHEVIDQPDEPVARIIRGKFKTPLCMTGDAGPGDLLARGDDGLPLCEGTVEAPFVIAIPKGVLEGGVASPTGLYGHGLLGSGDEAVSIAKEIDNFVVVGTDFWGMASEDIPNVLTMFSTNFAGGRAVPERLLQAAVNFSALGYLVAGDLAADDALMVDGKPLIDTTAIRYLGGSQGGIMGGTVMAFAPNFGRGVLVVGGTNYSQMVWRSSAFNEIDSFWKDLQPDPSEREFLMALFQSAFDLSDPAIYAEQVVNDPFPGNPPKDLLLVESIGDCQVPNLSSEVMARTYGMTMIGTPINDPWGIVSTIDVEGGGLRMIQVDTGKLPRPPKENLPPDDDNGAHGSSTDTDAIKALITGFLNKGVATNPCDGACDPD